MALIVDFQKVREDPTTVEYRFGMLPTMDRHLVIDRATGRVTPTDGTEDLPFEAAARKILRFHRQQNHWPEKGTYAA